MTAPKIAPGARHASMRPTIASDLLSSELLFASAMEDIRFGRFEYVPIKTGELVLAPWPTTVRGVKFGAENRAKARPTCADFELKEPVIEFFEYVRSVQQGEIRCLEVRHGLPFHMEIAQQPGPTTGAKHG